MPKKQKIGKDNVTSASHRLVLSTSGQANLQKCLVFELDSFHQFPLNRLVPYIENLGPQNVL